MKKKIILMTLFFVLFFAALAWSQERSPFEAASKNLYNYEKAVSNLILKGIITTSKFKKAVFLIDESYPVFSPGDSFNIEAENLQYTFKVSSIKKKSVIIKGGNKKFYEVLP